MTVLDYWRSDRGKLRCQTAFRDSTSDNGILNRHKNGTPFHYDNGTNTRHELDPAEKEHGRSLLLSEQWGELMEPDLASCKPAGEIPVPPVDIPAPLAPAGLPASLLNPPGLVGELARYHDATSRREVPLFGIAAGLAATSMLAGGQAVVALPDGATTAALYALVVAETGVGKEGARKVAQDAAKAADCTKRITDPVSAPALHLKLSATSAVLWCPDEFGRLLKEATKPNGSHGFGILTLVTKLYGLGCSFLEERTYADRKKTVPLVDGPTLSVLATTTRVTLVEALTSADVTNGFLNRFLLFPCDDIAPPRRRGKTAEFGKELRAHCDRVANCRVNQALAAGQPMRGETVPVGMTERWAILPTDPAVKMFDKFFEEIDRGRVQASPATRDLWVRGHENAIRVAGVVALGCWDGKAANPKLTQAHARYGINLAQWATPLSRSSRPGRWSRSLA